MNSEDVVTMQVVWERSREQGLIYSNIDRSGHRTISRVTRLINNAETIEYITADVGRYPYLLRLRLKNGNGIKLSHAIRRVNGKLGDGREFTKEYPIGGMLVVEQKIPNHN